ncbi:GPP34 family phosphoprotein [Kineosporia rhizophila]|uniref:GOLPH3/VPS74 family protein n=1 Tax=Kineosporia rhizophila TaxID=84633 RepID=UPI001E33698E|nr:GPP34 family phosphoprotein [Kineosporia rhizophila]MCE0536462.1 GPP34 family phosphoprotein [Kineosporia rhizophila]
MSLPTSPALAEDLLLLLFDPRSGTFAGEGQKLFHVLAGAVLVDLAVQERIEIDGRTTLKGQQVHPAGDEPPADPLLRPVWDRVADRPTDVHLLINEFGPGLRSQVLERVLERGDITRERRRVLGILPTSSLTEGPTARRAAVLAPVRAALVDGAEPDTRTAALGALLFASGSLPELNRDIPWSGPVYRRGEELQKGEWGAAAAGEAVRRTVAGISASSVFVAVVAPGS